MGLDETGVTGFQALRRGRCPVCRSGHIFAGRWQMNENCPVCRTHFERAPGYFVGAMYISYALALLALIVMVAIYQLGVFDDWPVAAVGLLGLVTYLVLMPAIFRWSRILWIHLGARIGW